MADFEKYAYKGTWSEALHIYLHTQLFQNASNPRDVKLEDYQKFELRDVNIRAFNRWVEEGCHVKEVITTWLNENDAVVLNFRENFGTTYKPKVEMWSDRSKTGYYKQKLQASFEFESFLERYFRENYDLELSPYFTPEGQYEEGENKLGIEIKNDTLIKKYGNVYIEYAEKANAHNTHYIESGILKNDKSKYFLIGDKDQFYIFRKARLVEIYNEEKALKDQFKPSPRGIMWKAIATSLGMAYPVKYAIAEAISEETLVQELRAQD